MAQGLQRPQEGRVLYNSFHGRHSDNPRAIWEELSRRTAAWTHVWIMAEGQRPVAARWVAVAPYSRAYLTEAGRSRYVVSNLEMPNNFIKKRGTTYVQTWHGTPLKRIGFDNPLWRDDPSGLRRAARDYAKWDVLVSPNRYSTDIFRRAFRFDGSILETGYPRNDALLASDRNDVRRRLRRQLGLKDGVTAVLYAPTWRDNLVDEHGRVSFELALDLPALSAHLGEGHVFLLRLHHYVVARSGISRHPQVRDVSDHGDIRDLYLAADVLLTDYSSAMFDFAVTGKPLVFYAYDLARYRDEVRGFYLDFEDEVPGPLCRDASDISAVLSDPDGLTAEHADRYAAFRRRFCHLDDGRAAIRVVDAVFGE